MRHRIDFPVQPTLSPPLVAARANLGPLVARTRSAFLEKGRWVVAVVPLLLAGLSGCGAGGDLPEIGLVKGRVLLDGKPLDAARVTFEPNFGRPSNGRTDAEGNFELEYLFDVPGAAIGPHTVRISTHDMLEDRTTGKMKMIPERVPSAYNNNSVLTAEVKGGVNEINFELKSDAK
ncbi:carboxypeptidase-like regulatory domain-containing protein [Planctomicrobium sp. SH664]|uniref:carboxypeptidase-like regulatory domain-containing protein n=1 Tax=Planctomicrobium sp. SH664 TaxID=3448125 RepID=UPI003F5BC958